MTGSELLLEILADPEKIEEFARKLGCSLEDIYGEVELAQLIPQYATELYENVLDILARILLVFLLSKDPERFFRKLTEGLDKDDLDCLLLEAYYGVKPKEEVVEEIKQVIPEGMELSLMILYSLKINLAYKFLQKVWEMPDLGKRKEWLRKLPIYVDLRMCCWKNGVTREEAKKIFAREKACQWCATCRSYLDYEP